MNDILRSIPELTAHDFRIGALAGSKSTVLRALVNKRG